MTKKVYFVAGEASGDNHGAALMRALRARSPEMQLIGRGGPRMRAVAGQPLRDWIEDAAVLGLWEVIKHYAFFRREFAKTIAEIDNANPDAIVLIDYPGFNLRLARSLRARFSSLKIIYYISPQVWAWNRRRIEQMAKWLDLMLCIFPFEPALYEAVGLRAVFVGHPMTSIFAGEEERLHCARSEVIPAGSSMLTTNAHRQRDRNLVALFPGSREREIRKIFPIMREAALELARRHADLHFAVAAVSEPLAAAIRDELHGKPGTEKFSIRIGQARALMQMAETGMVASGTATLEAALWRLPFVLVYRVAWMTYLAARLVIKVRYLGMPNVLADRQIVPEFIQHRARPVEIASAIEQLLEDGPGRARMLADFALVTGRLGQHDASENAADAIIAELRRPE